LLDTKALQADMAKPRSALTHRRGNADADTIASVYQELRRRGRESALLVLLDSADIGVVSWSAAHAMDFAPAEGEPVLMALAESDESGLIGFGAKMTLREWREGRLRFP
jgi:hypothetical protein